MANQLLEWTWRLILGLTAAFYIACYVVPRKLVVLQSMPWAFHFEKNIDLDLQSILYATYHTRWFSRFTHLTIPIEQVAWFVVLALVHPALIGVAMGLLGIQAARCREFPLAIFVMIAWTAVAGAAFLAVHLLGAEIAHYAAILVLLVSALWRVVGHAVEPIPPMMAERSDRFVSILSIEHVARKIPASALLLGYLSEFASGLPFRLFIVQINWLAQAFGYRPRRTMPWSNAQRIAQEIHARGWRAHPPIAQLVDMEFMPAVQEEGKGQP